MRLPLEEGGLPVQLPAVEADEADQELAELAGRAETLEPDEVVVRIGVRRR